MAGTWRTHSSRGTLSPPLVPRSSPSPLELFQPHVAAWFRRALGEPTQAQALGWPSIARGESTLLLAPTGSGKTLAAFLVAIDRLIAPSSRPNPRRKSARVLYVSPLKALAVDVERNLRAPIEGILEEAARSGVVLRRPTVDLRTGDTPAKERARMARAPADVLITTPESLYLILTSRARETLAHVETVIIDEIHSLLPTKRGAHLALSIERLEALRPPRARPLQRIGLSATQRPLDEAARLLGGFHDGALRPVVIVDAGARKTLELTVETVAPEAPAEGPTPELRSIWPGVHARLVELVRAHRSTLVFVNSRRLAERLATALNDAAEEEIALAHHGSLAREKRAVIEERLKRGELRALVATSSLELGIDMGAIDLVVQIESPPSVASGLQRVGRACHGVDGVPRGVLVPKHRQDLVACAAMASSMRAGGVEETFYPRNPLDVLAQQIVATVSMHASRDDELYALLRQAAPFAELPRSAYEGVLDMLSGLYPSDDFADLRPRITWDRARGTIEPRVGAHRLAVTNGGTIPDRGLYGVFLEPDGASGDGGPARRVGELDEEMVFELGEGEVFLLGASSWRAVRITHDRVLVTPAPGEPGKMPFWHGDRAGRSRAFGMRVGELLRRIAHGSVGNAELAAAYALTPTAADDTIRYVRDQAEATGELPTDVSVVIERFVDELGDWRVVVMCPFGTRVLAPWAIAVAARLREAYVDVDLHYTDDGMAFRIPACETPPPAELFVPAADGVEATVTRALDGTSLFAARFRECAARALLLPRRDPRRRTPLWAQRKRASDLLGVASRYPSFPIVLEAYRECLRDAFDLGGLVSLLRDIEARRVRVTTVDSRAPSPFASNVLFAFVARFIYDADAPPAERRAQALTIDPVVLRELLGEAELRTLLDGHIIAEHEASLQRTARPATSLDAVHDLLLSVGDLSLDELRARALPEQADAWADALVRAGRAVVLRIAGEERYAAVEDAARFRDALGVVLPGGIPPSLLRPAADPLRALVARFARTHGPFTTDAVARRLGLDEKVVEDEARTLLREGRLVEGAFLPEGTRQELCSREVLDIIRRRSLAQLRKAVEPVAPERLADFVVQWQGLETKRRGRDALLAVVRELRGCPLVASDLESEILPARIAHYRPWDLDALCASGEVVWAGLEPLGANDGRVALYPGDGEAALARAIAPAQGTPADAIRAVLSRRGAVFFSDIVREVGGFPGAILEALWSMVWAGEVTNDTLEPLRRRIAGPPRRQRPLAPRPPPSAPTGSEGRWSLRASRWGVPPSETERRAATARALLDRYGVVTREAAHAEGVAGGFAATYGVLKALEDAGRVRRGYFVDGRGGAQFALGGADERLRQAPPPKGHRSAVVLAATDPANAWGALLDWPPTAGDARPQRAAGALVVLLGGSLIGWMGRGEHPLLTFLPEGKAAEDARALAHALGAVVDSPSRRALLISSIDGLPAADSPLVSFFAEAGFVRTARGLLKRKSPAGHAVDAHPPPEASFVGVRRS